MPWMAAGFLATFYGQQELEEHFYDAFSIDHELDLRTATQDAFDLPPLGGL